MTVIESVWAGGQLVDLVLALIALEVVLVLLVARVFRVPAEVLPLLLNILSGACLILGLREALGSGAPVVIVLCLTASLGCHLADLFYRYTPRNSA